MSMNARLYEERERGEYACMCVFEESGVYGYLCVYVEGERKCRCMHVFMKRGRGGQYVQGERSCRCIHVYMKRGNEESMDVCVHLKNEERCVCVCMCISTGREKVSMYVCIY